MSAKRKALSASATDRGRVAAAKRVAVLEVLVHDLRSAVGANDTTTDVGALQLARSQRSGAEAARRDLEAAASNHARILGDIAARLGAGERSCASIMAAADQLVRRSDELHRDLLREQRIVDALVAKARTS